MHGKPDSLCATKPDISIWNKNDRAEAICEAVGPGMRSAKTMEQQDVQCLHRIQSGGGSGTAQVNQIRGLLLEYGITIPQGRTHVRKHLPLILEDAENGLTMRFRGLLSALYDELIRLDERIGDFDRQIEQLVQADSVPAFAHHSRHRP